ELHQVHDRTSAGRSRRPGSGDHNPGPARPGPSSNHQPGTARRGLRPGLRSQPCAESAAQCGAFKFVRLWRHQRLAHLQKMDGVGFLPLICTDDTDMAETTARALFKPGSPINFLSLIFRPASILALLLTAATSFASSFLAGKWAVSWEPVRVVN